MREHLRIVRSCFVIKDACHHIILDIADTEDLLVSVVIGYLTVHAHLCYFYIKITVAII